MLPKWRWRCAWRTSFQDGGTDCNQRDSTGRANGKCLKRGEPGFSGGRESRPRVRKGHRERACLPSAKRLRLPLPMKVLFLGDVVGKPGRRAIHELLPRVVGKHQIDVTVANVENSANGAGVTPETAEEILSCQVQVLTSGNHIWDKKEIVPLPGAEPRPPPPPRQLPVQRARPRRVRGGDPRRPQAGRAQPGGARLHEDPRRPVSTRRRGAAGAARADASASSSTCTARPPARSRPWAPTSTAASRQWWAATPTCRPPTSASSRAARRSSPTSGMCGPLDSIIGVKKELALARFLTQRPAHFETAKNLTYLQGAVVDHRRRHRTRHRDRAHPRTTAGPVGGYGGVGEADPPL